MIYPITCTVKTITRKKKLCFMLKVQWNLFLFSYDAYPQRGTILFGYIIIQQQCIKLEASLKCW
jgi:hypothetical protein